jgi:iron(II)-dependent oxidoreductase
MLASQEIVEKRETLLGRLADARERTDRLFGLVRPDSLYERPIPERHRIIFYLGHLEAFDWNLLRPRLLKVPAFDGGLDQLFAFGIDPVGGGLPSDRPSDWPSLKQIHGYNERIRKALDAGLDRASDPALLNVAIEHRLMHEETLSYMLHRLPLEKLREEPQAAVPTCRPVPAETVEIPEGYATLGLAREEAAGFGWDNEYEQHRVHVAAFAIDRYKATNGQYLAFLDAGGYRQRSLWSEAAWQWKEAQGIAHPVFWKRLDGRWHWRGMFEEIPLPAEWPVYVSHAEASAYACWAGKELPTEAEWHRAAYGTREGRERSFPWGEESPGPRHGYFDLDRRDPAPVDAFPSGRSAFGLDGLLANGWEWTATPFEPFPGFKPFEFYPGYSANFFDRQHYVMKGGSPRTHACMLRRSFRNWFQPHYSYTYAGFRCVSR